jgi:hypothetical protein
MLFESTLKLYVPIHLINVYIFKTNCKSYTLSVNYIYQELTKVIFILIYFLAGTESIYVHMLIDHVTSRVKLDCVRMSK